MAISHEIPEATVRTGKQRKDGDLHLAPGEGRIPSNLMREPNFDIEALRDVG